MNEDSNVSEGRQREQVWKKLLFHDSLASYLEGHHSNHNNNPPVLTGWKKPCFTRMHLSVEILLHT